MARAKFNKILKTHSAFCLLPFREVEALPPHLAGFHGSRSLRERAHERQTARACASGSEIDARCWYALGMLAWSPVTGWRSPPDTAWRRLMQRKGHSTRRLPRARHRIPLAFLNFMASTTTL